MLLYLPGHAEGDLAVWLPRQRILASGDPFDALLFGGHGTGALDRQPERAAERPSETVVPGHGPALGVAARTHSGRVTR